MRGWFGPKRFGYGIGPRSWQGWLASMVLLAVIIGSRFVPPEQFGLPHWTRFAGIGVLLVAYFVLVALTYDRDA